MTRYIYTIETQKSTMTTRFLKSFSKPLVINDKEVNSANPSEVRLFNDREEVYTFITLIKATSKQNLISQYRDLVEKYKVSLEYTDDDGWVYLIEKCPHDLSPIAHQLPARPLYNSTDPLKFYKEKFVPDEESEESDIYSSFFTAEYYNYFKLTYNRLTYFYNLYQTSHSINYIIMEAFLLTLGKWFSREKDSLSYSYFSTYHYRIVEKPYEPNEPADLFFYGEELITYIEAENYVRMSQEGKLLAFPAGEFYCFLPKPQLMHLYYNFFLRGRTYGES